MLLLIGYLAVASAVAIYGANKLGADKATAERQNSIESAFWAAVVGLFWLPLAPVVFLNYIVLYARQRND
jgi:Na+-driven multidrug efflux pump